MASAAPASIGLLLLASPAAAFANVGNIAREVVNFDFGWRHQLGAADEGAAKPGYNDSLWQVINAPHDMLIEEKVSIHAPEDMGYRPRNVGWYRKHFTLPAEWRGSAVWLYVEGAFHVTTAWLNGEMLGTHECGYTSFTLRLDGPSAVWGGANVLSLYVDASSGTGWWYEGGGLMRHNHLVRAPKLHVLPDSAWSHANLTGRPVPHSALPSDGATASATMYVECTVTNEQPRAEPAVLLRAKIYDAAGALVGSPPPSAPATVDAGGEATLAVHAPIEAAELWSVARPYLYTVALELLAADGSVVDALNVSAGVRSVRFDAEAGLYLNEQPLKLRGFCDHSNMGGVGGAVPDRLQLYRAQALRAVGGNAWRMAHNPPVPARLEIADRLGMLVMDENRDYGGQRGQGGSTNESLAAELADMADMVTRDRRHPSVFVWSFCNEVGCDNESAAAAFRAVAKLRDPTRAVTQNHLGAGEHPLSTASLDVQGFSHKSGANFDGFHAHNPAVPEMATECCSCLSQRGVDVDDCPAPRPSGCKGGCTAWCGGQTGSDTSDGTFYNNEIATCTAEQVNRSDARAFVAGTFVWSGFDYLGESRGYPQTAKCRGVVLDAAGFRKESAWWMQAWWLSRVPLSDAGRPALADRRTVRIVEAWRPARPRDGSKPAASRTVHVYTDGARVALHLNGQLVNVSAAGAWGVSAFAVPYAPGNLTAVALDAEGAAVARHSQLTPGSAASIRLSLDAPSLRTGTGSAVVADGEDVALVRAELLDAHGRLASEASDKLSFRVVSGEGRIWATHSGDPADTAGPLADAKAAYHGLLRVVVRSASDRATPQRWRMRQIDRDAGVLVGDGGEGGDGLPPIVLSAAAEGLETAELQIPLTTDLGQRAVAVAGSMVRGVAVESF